MSKLGSQIPEYDCYQNFYREQVIPHRKANPSHIRLDGNISGASRKVSAYFWYLNKKWKIDADTYIDRLTLAFEQFEFHSEPLIIKDTRHKKGKCLIIEGQPLRNKMFYVYIVGQR